ncbi:hypothetical protein TWF696_005446 [Orbilia brochopaga]|uniref:Uncharacterized protein n=1 Tax=Orbilia brochopaga TaxID=3140254 RepID=A0AAV9V425_9PEZI
MVSGCSAADLCDDALRKRSPRNNEAAEGDGVKETSSKPNFTASPTSKSEDDTHLKGKLESSGTWTIVNPSRAETPSPVGKDA